MRALLLAVLSLLSLLSPCERTRALVCRNPPLAVEPAVEQPPLAPIMSRSADSALYTIFGWQAIEERNTC